MAEKFDRQHPQELDPNYRNKVFEEVQKNFDLETATKEASRCLGCKNARCIKGCPVGINIPEFVQYVAKGDIQAAGDTIRETSMLPSVCGRVCPQERQCEGSCVVGLKGEPVAIGALERFVGDNSKADVKAGESTSKKVAVVGSGCAGISAAADLAKAGHEVSVFEALHELGGVLRYGIPSFRLPRTVLDREIESLKSIGVKFYTNVVVGKSITLNDLNDDGYDAIFLCSGAGLPKMLRIEGENLNGVYSANEFLTRINLMSAHEENRPTPIRIGKKVAVIGGGNTAMDAARTAKRIGFEEVYIVYRRTEAELPARVEEVKHAKEEGVVFKLLHSPLEIEGKEGYVSNLKLQVMELGEPDESGRRRPVPVEGNIVDMELDTVIVALGTNPNPIIQSSAAQEGLELDVNKWGYITINDETGETSIPGVFAGGDVAPTGESNAINAMGAGKRAAKGINEYLTGKNSNCCC